MAKSSKGGEFERQICKELSKWWTKGERDDVFWRSSQSGGRATTRRKSGKSTYGQYGDVAATDPIGVDLLRVITIELKRGYSGSSFADAFDKPVHKSAPKQQLWESFVEQACRSAVDAESISWLLIQKRDKRHAVVFMPKGLYRKLKDAGAFFKFHPSPFLDMLAEVRTSDRRTTKLRIVAMLYSDFLKISPDHFKRMAQ